MISDKHGENAAPMVAVLDKGVDHSSPAHMIEDGALRRGENFYYPRETRIPKTRGGLVQYQGGTACPGKITGITVYTKNASTSYIVVSCIDAAGTGQELYFLDPSASYAKVQISSALGTLNPPSFLTFNGMLLIAVGGSEPLKFWQGVTTGVAAAAEGVITVVDYSTIVDGETMVVGVRTFTFRSAARTQPGEIAIGGSNNATATNIAAAIATDCFDCSGSAALAVVTVTAAKTGTAGDALAFTESVTGLTMDGSGTLGGTTAGANGIVLEEITTYQAPTGPSIVSTDKNLRVICAGDDVHLDRLFFSAPGNQHVFAYGDYGGGEYIDIGYLEGNTYSAVVPWKNEIFVHKTGQNKEVYRVHITDPDEQTWQISRKFYAGHTSAINHRCAMSVGDVHVMLDSKMFRTLYGSDAYDELLSGEVGNKVFDYLTGVTTATAFMAHNPEEIYSMVFPVAGQFCLCYHHASKRWMTFRFKERDIYCAVYAEALGLMLLGCDDGFVYQLSPTTFTDDGTVYSSQLTTKTYGGMDMFTHQVKGISFDYKHLAAGTGRIVAVTGKGDGDSMPITEFTILTAADLLYDATGYFETAGGDDNTSGLYSELSGSARKKQIAVGNSLEFDITIDSGGLEAQNLMVDMATVGREY